MSCFGCASKETKPITVASRGLSAQEKALEEKMDYDIEHPYWRVFNAYNANPNATLTNLFKGLRGVYEIRSYVAPPLPNDHERAEPIAILPNGHSR